MEEIKIVSDIDLKTYFNISLRAYLKPRNMLIVVFFLMIVQYTVIIEKPFKWSSEVIFLAIFLTVYGIVLPVKIYYACKRNMTKTPFLAETLVYTLNNDGIEITGDTIKTTTGWNYIDKLVEREKYFLLRSQRSFHYLPKHGFGVKGDIASLKETVKAKDIKFSYK